MKAHITMLIALVVAFLFGSTALAFEQPDLSKRLIAAMEKTNATKQLEDGGVELSYKLGETSVTFHYFLSGAIGICETKMIQGGSPRRFVFLDTGCDEKLDRFIVVNTQTNGREARERIPSQSRINQLHRGLLLNIAYVARVSEMVFPTDSSQLELPRGSSPRVVTRRINQTSAVELHGSGGIYFAYEVGPYQGGFEYDEIELAGGRKLCSSLFSGPDQKMIYFYDDDCDGKLDYWTYHNAPQAPTAKQQAEYELALGRLDGFSHVAAEILPKQ